MSHAYEYPRAALTVDCVVFGLDETDLKVLLIQRKLSPFQHGWALPGGFVRIDETLDEAARRELEEEAGVKDVYLEQLYSFSALDRDPRERVVTVAYYALAKLSDHRIRGDPARTRELQQAREVLDLPRRLAEEDVVLSQEDADRRIMSGLTDTPRPQARGRTPSSHRPPRCSTPLFLVRRGRWFRGPPPSA